MSSIRITNIDPRVSEKRLRSVFNQFGCITDIKYSNKGVIKKHFKARIDFRDKNSAFQACEFDNYQLEGSSIDVSIMNGPNGSRKPNYIKKHLFSTLEVLIILCIGVLSFLLRIKNMRNDPNVVVAGEAKTGFWISSYVTGKRYFDWDPPLAKIIYSLYARSVGYKGNFDFRNTTLPENKYTDDMYLKLRFFPCVCGSLVAPIIVAALFLRYVSVPSAIVAGILLSFDFSSIVQSRFIFIDPIVHLFVSLTIFFTCLLYRKNTKTVFFFQCFFAVCSFCSNFVAGTIFVLVFVSNYRLAAHQKSGVYHVFIRTCFLVWIAIMGIWFSMWGHLALTPKWGEGDRYTKRNLRKKSYTDQIPLLLYDMYRLKRDDVSDTLYQSRWFEWPTFKGVPTLIWSTESKDRLICAFNNPAAVFGSVLGAFVCMMFGKWDWTLGYCGTYFIFAFVRRATWVTSYQIPLIVGICALASALDRMHRPFKFLFSITFIVFAVYSFSIWNSWLYGFEQTQLELSKLTIWPRLRSIWRVK